MCTEIYLLICSFVFYLIKGKVKERKKNVEVGLGKDKEIEKAKDQVFFTGDVVLTRS